MKRQSTKQQVLVVLIMIALFVLIFLPIPIKVNKTLAAVELAAGDPDFRQPVTVTIQGTYHWTLLGDSKFWGDITFDTYPLTLEQPLAQGGHLAPALRHNKYGDSLDYGPWMETTFFGKIMWKGLFRTFLVQVYEPDGENRSGWNNIDGHYIVYPVHNPQQVIKNVYPWPDELLWSYQ